MSVTMSSHSHIPLKVSFISCQKLHQLSTAFSFITKTVHKKALLHIVVNIILNKSKNILAVKEEGAYKKKTLAATRVKVKTEALMLYHAHDFLQEYAYKEIILCLSHLGIQVPDSFKPSIGSDHYVNDILVKIDCLKTDSFGYHEKIFFIQVDENIFAVCLDHDGKDRRYTIETWLDSWHMDNQLRRQSEIFKKNTPEYYMEHKDELINELKKNALKAGQKDEL